MPPITVTRATVVKTAAFCLGTAVVLWFITVTTPSDDRTPQPVRRAPYVQSQP